MSRCLSLILFFLAATIAQAQTLTFDHGKVEFHTSSIMSDIEAVSEEIVMVLNVESGAFEIRIPIASFEFEYEMMQDHFNEEYLESDQYPDATFTGKIVQDISDFQEAIEVDVSGELTIHGVTKPTSFSATLSKKDELTKINCIFPIVFKDFDVEEPSILRKSVAKDVEVKGIVYLK